MDAITLLKNDHRTVEELFKKYEATGPRAHKAKRKVADRIIEELSKHAEIEEQVFYPLAREASKEATDLVLESLEEHHIVKWTLKELEDSDPQDERFDAKMSVLMENVRHHVKEEEQDLFPKIRKALTTQQLKQIGERMREVKEIAPSRPHPRSPDTPPGNIVAGPAAAILDAAKEAVRGVLNAPKEAPRKSSGKGSAKRGGKGTAKRTSKR